MVALMAVMVVSAVTTSEPATACSCDMWPLAAGNKWVIVPIEGDIGTWIEVTSQKEYNGYTAWRLEYVQESIAGPSIRSAFWVFVNGWLYETTDEGDLQSVPRIVGGMHRLFPAVFRDGEAFTMERWDLLGLATPTDFIPDVRDTMVILTSVDQSTFIPLQRDEGPSPAVTTIVGSCSGPCETVISLKSQYVKVGEDLRLSVPEVSGQDFQWYKDAKPIVGATASTYLKASAEYEDTGDYACRITDDLDGYGTAPVHVTVVFNEALPALGTAGVAGLVALLSVSGARRAARRNRT